MAMTGDTTRDDEAIERQRLQSYTTIGTVLLAIIAIIVVLIFWRGCEARETELSSRAVGGTIAVLPDRQTEPGDIAVWLTPGTNIDEIVARYELAPSAVTPFGDGTYVISIPEAEAEGLRDLMRVMRDDPALFDAGFVYTER